MKYYGEYYIQTQVKLAPNAVVILNHLCYASGNSESGPGEPDRAVATQRVDNFGAGFLRTGARAIFAEGVTDASYILSGPVPDEPDDRPDLHKLIEVGRCATTSSSPRPAHPVPRPGWRPKSPGSYYRSVIGNLNLNATTVRGS